MIVRKALVRTTDIYKFKFPPTPTECSLLICEVKMIETVKLTYTSITKSNNVYAAAIYKIIMNKYLLSLL